MGWGGVGWTGGWEILLVLPTYLMLREGMFTYTCTRTLCFIANGVWAGQVIEKRLSCSLRRRIKASESDTTKHLHSQGWQNSSIAWTSCQTAVEAQEQWSLEAREKKRRLQASTQEALPLWPRPQRHPFWTSGWWLNGDLQLKGDLPSGNLTLLWNITIFTGKLPSGYVKIAIENGDL